MFNTSDFASMEEKKQYITDKLQIMGDEERDPFVTVIMNAYNAIKSDTDSTSEQFQKALLGVALGGAVVGDVADEYRAAGVQMILDVYTGTRKTLTELVSAVEYPRTLDAVDEKMDLILDKDTATDILYRTLVGMKELNDRAVARLN